MVVRHNRYIFAAGQSVRNPGGVVGIADFDDVGLFGFNDIMNAPAGYQQAIAARSDQPHRFHLINARIAGAGDGIAVGRHNDHVLNVRLRGKVADLIVDVSLHAAAERTVKLNNVAYLHNLGATLDRIYFGSVRASLYFREVVDDARGHGEAETAGNKGGGAEGKLAGFRFFKADGSVGGGVTDRLCGKGAGNAEFFLMLSVHAGNGFAQLLADGGEQGIVIGIAQVRDADL